MKRSIYSHLLEWKNSQDRKPLILRGARQVGKSFLAQTLGKNFDEFVQVNFEERPELIKLFEGGLNVEELLTKLSLAFGKEISPGKTLLFFDEIQKCPNALTSLRYFYEKIPSLHVLAAGSLIEFALEKVGIPVGRVRSLYVYPLSFQEFLNAKGEGGLADYLKKHDISKPIDLIFHKKLLLILTEYLSVGGMPEAVSVWLKTKSLAEVKKVHMDLVETFRQDFSKYAKRKQIDYVEKLFISGPSLTGEKFIFAKVDKDLKTRELKPALDLLEKAGIVHKVIHTSGNGPPLGAETDLSRFKIIFIDVALSQTILGTGPQNWSADLNTIFVNKGKIAEAFIGQEILAESDPFKKADLFYWVREKGQAKAEVDYLLEIENVVIPIEVKSGAGGKLKSLHQFLKEKKDSPYGFQFSLDNFQVSENIKHLPLYAAWIALRRKV